MKPFASNFSLHRSISPLGLNFKVFTHLHPTFFSLGNSTRPQVCFFSRAFISSIAASFHLGQERASLTPLETWTEEIEDKKIHNATEKGGDMK